MNSPLSRRKGTCLSSVVGGPVGRLRKEEYETRVETVAAPGLGGFQVVVLVVVCDGFARTKGRKEPPHPPVRSNAKASALSATAVPSLFLSFLFPFNHAGVGFISPAGDARGVVDCPTAYIQA